MVDITQALIAKDESGFVMTKPAPAKFRESDPPPFTATQNDVPQTPLPPMQDIQKHIERIDLLANIRAVVQYRLLDDKGYGPWATSRGFDSEVVARRFAEKLNNPELELPWEFRVVYLPA